MTAKVATWTAEVFALAKLLVAVYSAFPHGMIGHWVYLMRTIPNIGSLFQPLEDAIRLQLLPSITGHVVCTTSGCELFSVPCHFCGLGVGNPTNYCDSQFDASMKITAPLKD